MGNHVSENGVGAGRCSRDVADDFDQALDAFREIGTSGHHFQGFHALEGLQISQRIVLPMCRDGVADAAEEFSLFLPKLAEF